MKNRKLVVVSDGHTNSTIGLCPPTVQLEGGGVYTVNKYQKYLWECWLNFCSQIPLDSLVVINGDWIHGAHGHKDSQIISTNKATMRQIGYDAIAPLMKRKPSEVYFVRGTEWHEATGAEDLETVASMFPRTVQIGGQFSHWTLWMEIFGKKWHFAHHISMGRTSGFKQLDIAMQEFIMHDQPMPDYMIRSHRHQYQPITNGRHQLIVTPGWQLQTAFVVKLSPMSNPDIGGLIFDNNKGRILMDAILYPLPKPQIHQPK